MFDFCLALCGLVVLGVPLLVVAGLILAVDGRPVLFRQQRVGLGGRLFTIYKFRTMRNRRAEGSSVTVAGDGRVSGLGRWLRRFKVDELPQLLNVVRGEMSLVGPRPDVPGYADCLKGEARVVLGVRPGITGPASLAFRNEEALLAGAADPVRFNDVVIFPEKVRLNVEYVGGMSLWGDVKLIVKTVF